MRSGAIEPQADSVTGHRYEYGIDFGAVSAIDIHTHVEIDAQGHIAYDPDLAEATSRYFKLDPGRAAGVDALAAHYRRHNTAAVVFTIDAQTASGHRPNSVEELIAGAARNNDVLIPFGTVDPWSGTAVHRVRELAGVCGVKGFKFHPSFQGFEPNDRRFYPIYEAIAAAGVPALFHTGQTGLGSALPGGYGIKLRYSDPMLLDDVAADFPELTIVMAHPAVPWVDAQIAIASHKSNCYIDLSGWSPKYFPPQLVRALGRQLRGKALFGTDHPYITLERWRRDFDTLDIDPTVLPMILKDNALQVLGIAQT
jgi:predicted TIM-barrel fold metal-dependent hydrolase